VVPGSIVNASLTSGVVLNTNIADGQITLSKLAPRQIGTNVGVGGFAVSQDSLIQNSGIVGVFQVAKLSVTIATTGRPVYVGLIASTNSSNVSYNDNNSNFRGGYIQFSGGNPDNDPYAFPQFVRDSTNIISSQVVQSFGGNVNEIYVTLPASAFNAVDFPPAGNHTYSFQINNVQPCSIFVQECQLVVYEL
jgi:hypothetical protein